MQGGIDLWGGKEPRAIIVTSMYYTYEIGGAHSILCLVLPCEALARIAYPPSQYNKAIGNRTDVLHRSR